MTRLLGSRIRNSSTPLQICQMFTILDGRQCRAEFELGFQWERARVGVAEGSVALAIPSNRGDLSWSVFSSANPAEEAMTKQIRAKQERVIEAVRQGFEGDAAVEFIHQSGFAMTPAGIARHLRSMGGRAQVQDFVHQGLTNVEILAKCFPEDAPEDLPPEQPSQGELFEDASDPLPFSIDGPLYDTRKLSIRVPSDLYEAIRLAARGEGKSQNELIVEILTSALSRMPRHPEREPES